MERTIYNRKKLEIIALAEVASEHPEWTPAKQKEIAHSDNRLESLKKRLLIGDLTDKMIFDDKEGICQESIQAYHNKAQWIVDNIQPELIQNLNEFIDGNPLSIIKIHGIAIVDIMHQYNDNPTISFVRAIQCMIHWKEHNYERNYCYNFFTHR